MKRLSKFRLALVSILLFPLLHLSYIAVITVRNKLTPSDALERFFLESFVILLSPLALFKGRYPTTSELLEFSAWHFLGLVLELVIVWLIASKTLTEFVAIIRPQADRLLPRFIQAIVILVAGAGIFVWTIFPYRPSSDTAEIHIDFSDAIGEMPPLHRGYSQGGEIQMRDDGFFETAMEGLTALNPAFVRIDHLYDYYNVYSVDESGMPTYDWTELDRIVDAIFEAGAEPFMSISYMPLAMSESNMANPPTDLQAWEELVYQTVYHFNAERGLGIRYWEVWNEPNHSTFWNGSPEELFELYKATENGILRADPSVLVGGAGTASIEYLGDSVPILAEENWVIGLIDYVEENNLRFDFLSWHLYDPNPENYRKSIERHQQWVEHLDPQPLLILSEWNYTGGTTPKYDTGETLAYTAAVLDVLIDTPLDMALFFEPIDGTLQPEGYWGLMYQDGTPKPLFAGFQLLNSLSGEKVSTESSHPDAGAIATHNVDSFAIIVWNDRSGHNPISITLTLGGLPSNETIVLDITNSSLEIHTVELRLNDKGEGEIEFDVPENELLLLTFDSSPP